MAITRIEGKTVRRSVTKPTPCASTSTTTILMSREPDGSKGERLVEIGLRDDARAAARESRLDDVLRMLLACEDDLDLAAVRLDPRDFLTDKLDLDRAADVSAPARRDPRQRVCAGPADLRRQRQLHDVGSGLRCRAFQV
jgi:hypothetical protein